jgi:hypothetical protein
MSQSPPENTPPSAFNTGNHANDNGNGHTLPAIKPTQAIQRARSHRWPKRFLEVFRQTGIVRAAAEAAGVDRTMAYKLRDKNPKFAAEWDKAILESTELLELHCLQRATQGETEEVWMNTKEGPKKVSTKKVKSDRLLEFMLRARKPQIYRDNVNAEITGPNGTPLAPVVIPQTVVFNIPGNNRGDPAHIADTQQLKQISATTMAQISPAEKTE